MAITTTVERLGPDLIRVRHLIVNLYLWGTPERWVLIDAGMPGATGIIVEAAEEHFGERIAPEAVILTHGHFDHVGAFPDLFERWDVPVYAHPLELPYLTGQESYPPPDPFIGEGVMPLLSMVFPKGPIDLGDRVRALPQNGDVPGMSGWRWIHTPGHSDGHVSLYRDDDRSLIAGDAFVTTKQESIYAIFTQEQEVHGPPAYFTPDWRAAKRSVEALAALRPSLAATGHGTPMRGEDLTRQLDTLAANFEQVAVPDHGKYVPDEMKGS
ncbi:MAG: MBL fold metallo-hydrolase [Chloroflexota bacterium]|nr:MBL fold metallo-hydrolase [Chloroflexota bacterium]